MFYHYTDFNGLKGILSSREIWCTEYRGLNDSSELRYSQKFLEPEIKNLGLELSTQTILRALKEVYLFSCCKHDNDYDKENGLLSMWRGYGSSGGYALVFNKNPILANEEKYAHFEGEVEYPKNSKEFHDNEENKKSLNHACKFIKRFVLEKSSPSRDELNAIIKLLMFRKHHAFFEEREYRIAIMDMGDGVLKPSIRDKGNYLCAYISIFIKNFENCLEKIIIGPHQDQDNQELYLNNYLKTLGYIETKVIKSEIPYRG